MYKRILAVLSAVLIVMCSIPVSYVSAGGEKERVQVQVTVIGNGSITCENGYTESGSVSGGDAGEGTVSGGEHDAGAVWVDKDADVVFTIQPEEGFYVSDVKIDGNAITPENVNIADKKDGSYTYTFVSILQDSSIEATFSSIETVQIEEEGYELTFEKAEDNVSRIEAENQVTYILTHGKNAGISFRNYTILEDLVCGGIISEDKKTITYGADTVNGIKVILHSTATESFVNNTIIGSINLKFIADAQAPALSLNGETLVWLSGQEEGYTISGTTEDIGESGIDRIVWFTEEKDVNVDAAEILSENVNCVSIQDNRFEIDISAIPDAEVTYYIYAIDKASNIAGEIKKFQIDSSAPTVKVAVEGIDGNGATKKEKVRVTVEASDTQAGVQEIILYLDGEIVDRKENDKNFVYEVILKRNAQNIITASAVDRVGNTSEAFTYEGGLSGILFDNVSPMIKITAGEEAVQPEDSEKAYCLDNTALTIAVADTISGISKIEVEMNGQPITEDADGNAFIIKRYGSDFVVNTSQVEPAEDNKYILKVTAVDNVGNEQIQSKTIYIDTKAPVIDAIITDTEPIVTGSEKMYGYFGADAISMQVIADDGEDGVGVDYVEYYTLSSEGTKSETHRVKTDENNKVQIQLSADFKGHIYARAVDLLGNVSDIYQTTYGCVLESANMHEKENHIELMPAAAAFTDANGNALYAGDTEVKVTVTDTYSGIETIEWRIEAPQDTEKNTGGVVKVSEYGVISDTRWTATKTEQNLVTQITGSISVQGNSNDIVVYVKMTDRAGNTSEKQMLISIDKTAPAIGIVFDHSEADEIYTDYFNKNRTAIITVTERNFSAEMVELFLTSRDGATPVISEWTQSRDTSNPDNNTYTATLTFTGDGDYILSAAVTDLAGNKSAVSEEEVFTIDKTEPQVEVSFDDVYGSNGSYYNNQRVATIRVKEHNFDAERVQVSGTVAGAEGDVTFPKESVWRYTGEDIYEATIIFSRDGEYAFSVNCSDKAGNISNTIETENYIIDMSAPEIVIGGVENLSANNGTVEPYIQFGDKNYDSQSTRIELTGTNGGSVPVNGAYSALENGQMFFFEDFAAEQSVDDIYTLTAFSTDLAGNEASESIVFSVNRFGSIYVIDDSVRAIEGTYVQKPVEVKITETNVDELVKDTIKVVLIYNGTPDTLEAGTDYTVEKNGGDGSWSRYEYVLDETLFANDGAYIVNLYSEDAAGNINENIDETKKAEITFGVDATNPVIVPLNIADDGMYNSDNYEAVVSVADNLILSEVNIWVNGERVSYESEEDTCIFHVPESAKKQTIVISAEDAAGNSVAYQIKDLLVSTNFFVRWSNNKTAVAATAAGAGVCVSGVGAAIGLRRRRLFKTK